MHGVGFLQDRKLELRESPDPRPGEVVLALKASGMCGSDLHLPGPAGGGQRLRHPQTTGTGVFVAS